MPKFHLAQSDTPIPEGTNITALCEKEIPKAAFVFFFDTSFGAATPVMNSISACRRCRDRQTGLRYLYGIVEGEALKQPE